MAAAAGTHRIFGSDSSPYSVKVRAYFRYKGIPHEWVLKNVETSAEYERFARLPILPTVAAPDGRGLQDSTPIIEALELQFPEPSIHPPGEELRFLSELLEEYGDEWGNKWAFHFRWARDVDREAVSARLAAEVMPGLPEDRAQQLAASIRQRMTGRGFVIGSNERTAPLIERSFREVALVLEEHLRTRPYLFGARPALADFGLAPQVHQALIDPTAGGILRDSAPRVCAWCERMLDPCAAGAFESWESLRPGLEPLLRHAGLFLRWSAANARAVAAGAATMSVELDGAEWWQTIGSPQRYHAKSLAELRRKHQAVAGRPLLRKILERCGCLEELAPQGPAKL